MRSQARAAIVATCCSAVFAAAPTGAISARQQSIAAARSNWGLDRIDQRTPALDGLFRYAADGTGVHVYLVDTGAWITHEDFGGRASIAANLCAGAPSDDVDGHGTHTASIAAGRTFGVAKNAAVHALKAFGPGCTGAEPVLAALDWVIERGEKPAVVNLSSGSFNGDARVQERVRGVARAGFPIAVSAGCMADTAKVWGVAAREQADGVFIAGSLARGDAAPPPIDYGAALTLFAPAIDITAAQTGYPDRANNASATVYPPQANPTCADSFAAPHVAGVIATYLQDHRDATPAQVYAALITGPTHAWTTGVKNRHGAPDRVLQSLQPGR